MSKIKQVKLTNGANVIAVEFGGKIGMGVTNNALVFFEISTQQHVGELTDENKSSMPSEVQDNSVMFLFNNEKSIDVVINSLELARKEIFKK